MIRFPIAMERSAAGVTRRVRRIRLGLAFMAIGLYSALVAYCHS